jgi:hypothetical protein
MEQHKMTKPFETIYDIISGETTIREFTDAEIKKLENEKKENAKLLAIAEAETEAKAVARQVIAERLGLTVDELQVLLG